MTVNRCENHYLLWLAWPEKCFHANQADVDCLKALVPKDSTVTRVDAEKAFLKHLPTATHAIVWHFKPEWFALAPKLKLLATPSAGREFIPQHGPKGVKIHFGTFHGPIMAEYVLAYMYGQCRGMHLLLGSSRPADPWPRTWLSDKCTAVCGTKAVVLGYGHVGKAIGSALMANGVEVMGLTRSHGAFMGRKRTALSVSDAKVGEFLGDADWLVMALPATGETDNIVDGDFIRRLPRKCSIINVGRGNSIDERALYKALKSGRLRSACLDVRKHEPSQTALEAKGYVPELADLPNCMVTPHVAAFSPEYLRMCFKELSDARLLSGKQR